MCLRPIQLSPSGVPLFPTTPLNNNSNFNNYIKKPTTPTIQNTTYNKNQSNSNKKAVELVVHHLHFYFYYYYFLITIIIITFTTTALRCYHGNVYYRRYEKTNNNGTIMEH